MRKRAHAANIILVPGALDVLRGWLHGSFERQSRSTIQLMERVLFSRSADIGFGHVALRARTNAADLAVPHHATNLVGEGWTGAARSKHFWQTTTHPSCGHLGAISDHFGIFLGPSCALFVPSRSHLAAPLWSFSVPSWGNPKATLGPPSFHPRKWLQMSSGPSPSPQCSLKPANRRIHPKIPSGTSLSSRAWFGGFLCGPLGGAQGGGGSTLSRS